MSPAASGRLGRAIPAGCHCPKVGQWQPAEVRMLGR